MLASLLAVGAVMSPVAATALVAHPAALAYPAACLTRAEYVVEMLRTGTVGRNGWQWQIDDELAERCLDYFRDWADDLPGSGEDDGWDNVEEFCDTLGQSLRWIMLDEPDADVICQAAWASKQGYWRRSAQGQSAVGHSYPGVYTLGVTTAVEAAEDTNSANYMMPHCRNFLTIEHSSDPLAPYCVGMVRGILFTGSILRDLVNAEGDRRLPCIDPPSGATYGQSVQVVVTYIDARPARMHEHFGVLALEALRAAWPCRM
jgi:hypothetical protein